MSNKIRLERIRSHSKKLKESIQKPALLINIFVSFLLGIIVFFIQTLGPAIRTPYWLDEAWVALSIRYPIKDLSKITASTPIGFSFLLRLFPDRNDLRIIPLIFLIAAVICGYWLGLSIYRKLNDVSIWPGLLIASFLIFAPFLIGYVELKQYTADAFVSVLILMLCANLDNSFSIKKVGTLGIIIPICMTISHTSVFIGGAAFMAVVIWLLINKTVRKKLYLTCGIFILSLGVCFIYYLTIDKQGKTVGLTNYWAPFFPTIKHIPVYILNRIEYLAPLHLLSMALILLILFGLGLVNLFRLNKKITGLTVILVVIIAILAGLTKVYPLLDERTSTYLLTVVTVSIALGFLYVLELTDHFLNKYIASMLLAVAIIFLFLDSFPSLATYSLEDTRDASNYVHEHYREGDIIVVTPGASYGFAFYWPSSPKLCSTKLLSTGFIPCYPNKPITVLAQDSKKQLEYEELVFASKINKENSVWIIASHISYSESQAINHWIKTGDLAFYRGNAEVIRIQRQN